MNRLIRLNALALACCLSTAAMAGNGPVYTINGSVPGTTVIRYLLLIGHPAGDYWLKESGEWGRAGSPDVLGQLYEPLERIAARTVRAGTPFPPYCPGPEVTKGPKTTCIFDPATGCTTC